MGWEGGWGGGVVENVLVYRIRSGEVSKMSLVSTCMLGLLCAEGVILSAGGGGGVSSITSMCHQRYESGSRGYLVS